MQWRRVCFPLQIDPDRSKVEVLRTKIEVTMAKAGNVQWVSGCGNAGLMEWGKRERAGQG